MLAGWAFFVPKETRMAWTSELQRDAVMVLGFDKERKHDKGKPDEQKGTIHATRTFEHALMVPEGLDASEYILWKCVTLEVDIPVIDSVQHKAEGVLCCWHMVATEIVMDEMTGAGSKEGQFGRIFDVTLKDGADQVSLRLYDAVLQGCGMSYSAGNMTVTSFPSLMFRGLTLLPKAKTGF